MLALRTVRAVAAVPAPCSSTPTSTCVRGKATAPKPQYAEDHDDPQQRTASAASSATSASTRELLEQLAEQEVRFAVPWGHVAGTWWGRTDRRPLVALHGWGDNAGSFQRLAGSLRGVPVLALDLPGHGLTSPVPRGVAPTDRGLLLATLRRVHGLLGGKPLSLIGHSLGDAVALLYAATFPSEVDMYVSLDTLVPTNAPTPDLELKMTGVMVDELLEAEAKLDKNPEALTRTQLRDNLLGSSAGSLNRLAAETLLRRGAQGSDTAAAPTLDPRVLRSSMMVLPPALALACARNVRCPTLAVLPEWRAPQYLSADPQLRDRFFADLRFAAKSVTTASVTGTHHAHLNSPEVVVPALQDFLDQHRTPAHEEQAVPVASLAV